MVKKYLLAILVAIGANSQNTIRSILMICYLIFLSLYINKKFLPYTDPNLNKIELIGLSCALIFNI